mmetsp:Transcript_37286/g.89157  ORF Transcript_37286/g.89157 Transcript_37286/m.89157 type:complete len:226 (+) Transcript_37286:696-1373(+)
MKKCIAAIHHKNLLRSSCFQILSLSSAGSALESSAGSCLPAANLGAAQSSAEGRPTFSGASFMKIKAKAPAMTAMMPGPIMPARQPKLAARVPASNGMRKPPMLWDAFQLLHHLPRLRAGNQLTSILLHGVAPQPWNSPLSNQMNVKIGTELAVEKAMLRTPVIIKPREKIKTGEPSTSDKMPDRNLEFMYAKGNKELMAPSCTMLRPRSLRMARPTYVKESRVK